MSEMTVEHGIEWYRYEADDEGRLEEVGQCARCGSSVDFLDCWNCGGEGVKGHDCGEDCCACLHPEDNVGCEFCDGRGGSWHCIATPAWCETHPLAGREHIQSTALKPGVWEDR